MGHWPQFGATGVHGPPKPTDERHVSTIDYQSSLVPPARLGALLSSHRQTMGIDVVDLSRRSQGRFTPTVLSDIERGRVMLDDMTVARVTELYEVDQEPVIPARSRLVVDLDAQQLAIGDRAVQTAGNDVDSVLERYLSLLYILRNLQPGTELTLREHDMAVLANTLQTEITRLEQRLGELMLGSRVEPRMRSLLRRFKVPAAGLLVAATAVGSLVIISGAASDSDVLATPIAGGDVATQVDAVANAAAPERIVVQDVATASTTVVDFSQTDDGGDTPIAFEVNASTSIGSAPETVVVDIGATDDTPAPETTVEFTTTADVEVGGGFDAAVIDYTETGPGTDDPNQADIADSAPEPVVVDYTETATASENAAGDEGAGEQIVMGSSSSQAAAIPELGLSSPAVESPQAIITSEAAETPVLSAQEQLDALGSAAEAQIGYDWRAALPGWAVVYDDSTPGYRGLTHWPSKTITLYVDAGDTADDVADVLAHEIGHAIDVTYLDNDTRTEWLEMRGMPMVWWAGNGLNDFSVGAGDFAEAVAALWVDSPSDSNYGEFTQEQLQFVQSLLPQ